jgi:hypothetical protein
MAPPASSVSGAHTFTSATRTNGLSALESRSSEAHSGFCSLTRIHAPQGPARSCVRDSDPAVRPREPRDDCAAVAKGCGRAMPGGEFFDVVLDGSRCTAICTVPGVLLYGRRPSRIFWRMMTGRASDSMWVASRAVDNRNTPDSPRSRRPVVQGIAELTTTEHDAPEKALGPWLAPLGCPKLWECGRMADSHREAFVE